MQPCQEAHPAGTSQQNAIWASSKAKPLLSQIRFTQAPHGNFPELCCVIPGTLPVSQRVNPKSPGALGTGVSLSGESWNVRSQLTRLMHFSSILLCFSPASKPGSTPGIFVGLAEPQHSLPGIAERCQRDRSRWQGSPGPGDWGGQGSAAQQQPVCPLPWHNGTVCIG